MSNIVYFSIWLGAALVVIAWISAAIASRLRRNERRANKAPELLAALAGYSDWVAAQRGVAMFQVEHREKVLPLEQARAIVEDEFPELSDQARGLYIVHEQLLDFFKAQQLLRLKDPEAWIESDHDAHFMELWCRHRHALHAVTRTLLPADGTSPANSSTLAERVGFEPTVR